MRNRYLGLRYLHVWNLLKTNSLCELLRQKWATQRSCYKNVKLSMQSKVQPDSFLFLEAALKELDISNYFASFYFF